MNAFWTIPICAAVVYGGIIIHTWPATEADAPPAPTKEKPVPPAKAPSSPPDPNSTPDHSERADIERLQEELRSIEKNIALRERFLEASRKKADTGEAASLLDGGLTPNQWAARGRETPEKSVETLLWAGAGGDAETMVESIALDETSSQLAAALFARLPQDIQSRYSTPESIIAAMIIDDIPLAKAKILSQRLDGEQTSEARLVFASNIDPAKLVKLRLQKQESGEWKVIVPPKAIARYASELGLPIYVDTP